MNPEAILTSPTETDLARGGRVGPGSVYECFHGDNRVTRQTILEWLPLERMTTEDTTPVPGATALISLRLTPTESGTQLALIVSKARGKWLNRWACDLVGRFIVPKQFRGGMHDLVARIEKEMAEGLHRLPEPVEIAEDHIGEAVEASVRGVVRGD